jgi:hypothetical protein
MVRRRSTVRFRNGAPAQRGFSNFSLRTNFKDQVTNLAVRIPLISCWQLNIATYLGACVPLTCGYPTRCLGAAGCDFELVRCPSPLPGEWLRFPGCGGSRLMKFAPDGSRGSSRPSPAGGDPAGPVPQYRGGPSRTGIRGDELRAAVSRWSKCGLTARCARVGAGTGAGRCVRRRTSCICKCRGSRTMFGRLRVCPRPRGGARRSRRHR